MPLISSPRDNNNNNNRSNKNIYFADVENTSHDYDPDNIVRNIEEQHKKSNYGII